ncbi:DUF3592 domain-containing protein [Nocardia rhamnosiphila]|uniref:DUF3592 domain-containing protein n=1 Tax=Nocardia rhamnosiphila TaxID=426716 RepID=UPI0004C36843|nr:DUF3592 domain-containing protein [Nocardia rhamnosiphila]
MQRSLAAGVDSNRLAIALMGVVAILFAAVPIGYNALFLVNSQIATGTAVEFGHELTDNTKGSRPAGTSTVIEFTTAAGETVRFDGGPAASSLYTDLGDRVPVRYDPGDPDHAMVDEAFLFVRLTYLPLIFAALGAAALGTVAWMMLLRSRIRQPAIR